MAGTMKGIAPNRLMTSTIDLAMMLMLATPPTANGNRHALAGFDGMLEVQFVELPAHLAGNVSDQWALERLSHAKNRRERWHGELDPARNSVLCERARSAGKLARRPPRQPRVKRLLPTTKNVGQRALS